MKKYKNLENKDRNLLYHKILESSWDNTGLFKINLSTELQVVCMCAHVCAATAYLYPLNFKQNQGAFGLKQSAIFQIKTLLCLAVSLE